MDLGALQGNRLEPLKGDRAGQHSIRINKRWRVCFRWEQDGPHDVEIVDYHQHWEDAHEREKRHETGPSGRDTAG